MGSLLDILYTGFCLFIQFRDPGQDLSGVGGKARGGRSTLRASLAGFELSSGKLNKNLALSLVLSLGNATGGPQSIDTGDLVKNAGAGLVSRQALK